jgi:hypothetical protein
MGNPGPGDFGGPEGPKQTQQPTAAPAATQSHGQGQDANPLSRLTEEQREEINEAVRITSRSSSLVSCLHSLFRERRAMPSEPT